MVTAQAHDMSWVTAAPLWRTAMTSPTVMQQPAILKLDSDNFMDDLTALLQTAPATLNSLLAKKESFRPRPAGAPPNWTPQPPVLKLYQPAHGHFCLVAASLVCRRAGMPEHTVESRFDEKAGFVLRRLGPNGEEMAWIDRGPAGKNWIPLNFAQRGRTADSEVLMPMFPISFPDNGRKRRVLVGLIPTASRETFQAAPAISPITTEPAGGPPVDPRIEEVEQRVLARWQELIDPASPLHPDQQIEISQFLLLDFADFLSTRLKNVWDHIAIGTAPAPGDPALPLYSILASSHVEGSVTWQAALKQAIAEWDRIGGDSPTPTGVTYNVRNSSLTPGVLRPVVLQALAGNPIPPAPLNGDTLVPKLDANATTTYVIRCVYQRPRCRPLHPDIVSTPTDQFSLAPFFDPDAPSRPIRIPLPVDTSQAGLRKFRKNVGFMISDKLRAQMGLVSDGKSALKGELGSGGGFDLGELCSFSIPIITLCAFIVLMIFISLLNIVFWWMPLLRICLPLKLKAKG